jgi:hypothetical protein
MIELNNNLKLFYEKNKDRKNQLLTMRSALKKYGLDYMLDKMPERIKRKS